MNTFTEEVCVTVVLLGLLALCVAVPVDAQDTIAVESIELQGLKVWSEDDVRPILQSEGLQSGKTYRRSEFDRLSNLIIRRLQDEGLFSDIQVSRNNGTVVFEFEEFNKITNIKFEGNSVYDDSKLRDAILLQVGSPANPYEINQAKRDISNFYRQKGYSSVDVESKQKITKRGRTIVTFVVQEGDQRTVNNIELEYQPSLSTLEEIYRNFSLRTYLPLKPGQPYSSQARKQSTRAIKQWYANRGYLDASVEVKLWRNIDKDGIDVRFIIHQGPKYHLGSVGFTGNDLYSDTHLRELFPIDRGEVFNSKLFRNGRRKIEQEYTDRGYAEVNITPSMQRLDEDGNPVVNLTLNITEGEPIYVERIEIIGNTKTYDRVIRREIRLEPGKLLDGQKKRSSLRRLRNLGFFNKVKMNINPGSRENWKVVRVRVEEGRTGQFQFGGGFSSSTGFTGNLSVRKDNFSLWDPYSGFTGRAQSLEVSAQVGERRDNFNISWDDPWFNDNFGNPAVPPPDVPLGVGWSAFNIRNDRRSGYVEIRQGGALRVSREFGPARSNKVDAELSGKTTLVKNITSNNVPLDIRNEAGSDSRFERTINSLELGIQRDRRNNRLFPTDGYYLRLSSRTAARGLGGDLNFYNPEFDGRAYIPSLGPTFVAARFNYKTIDAWGGDTTVPSFERFFLGGNRTVRGYDFRDILVYDGSTRQSGGNTAYFANIEYRFKVLPQTMQLFVFGDMGAVYEDSWQFRTDKIKKSTGFGLRVRSPMGPINISWSRRLDDTFIGANDAGQSQIDFNIGTGF
ncbi:MAG: outer membrane protein assembly factor BamA [bacterium]